MEKKKQIHFSDMQIECCSGNTIKTNWFRTAIASKQYIKFFSHHPVTQKIATVCCLVDKTINLSHPSFYTNNLKLVHNLLLQNKYPLKFIEKYIGKRLAILDNESSRVYIYKNKPNFPNEIIIPYVKDLAPQIKNILHKHSVLEIYKNENKLNDIKLDNDKLDTFLTTITLVIKLIILLI